MKPEELAAVLATQEGLAMFRSLQATGVMDGGGATPKVDASGAARSILEWEPVATDEGLRFERKNFFRCKPKSVHAAHPDCIRICLFGESMAAGFPLAPAYTPAIVLEDVLRTDGQLGAVEVIDLAVPNMGPSEQLRVCEAAGQLVPDVCVLMSGNNWYYGLSVEPTATPEARVHYGHGLENGGGAGLARAFRTQLEHRARVMVASLIEFSRSAGAIPIVVIPPANHDWERCQPLPWMAAGSAKRWYEHLQNARRLLRGSAFEEALVEAKQMVDVDPGVTGTPERLMVRALLGLGRRAEAREAANRANDAANWQNYSWALPQVPPYVADVMRAEAERLGCTCIDLDAVFAAYTGDTFLDFRLFYDQCHLSAEGMRVAMSAVADAVCTVQLPEAAASEDGTRSWQGFLPSAPSSPPLTLASGAFQAAHWLSRFFPDFLMGNLNERLVTMLKAGVNADSLLVDVLRDHVGVRNLSCTPGLNRRVRKATRLPGVSTSLLSTRLNPPLFAALLEVLRECGDPELKAIYDEVVESYQYRLRRGLNLVEPKFREGFWQQTPVAWHDPYAWHGTPRCRAWWPESGFSFLTDGSSDVHAELVFRSERSEDTVTVELNQKVVSEIATEPDWQRLSFRLRSTQLQHGLNRLRLRWPVPQFDDEKALRVMREKLSIGAETELFPVFGEVHALVLRSL